MTLTKDYWVLKKQRKKTLAPHLDNKSNLFKKPPLQNNNHHIIICP